MKDPWTLAREAEQESHKHFDRLVIGACFWGWLLLREVFAVEQIIGSAITLFAMYLGVTKKI